MNKEYKNTGVSPAEKAFRASQYKVHIKQTKMYASTHVFFYIKCMRVRLRVRASAKTQNSYLMNVKNN